MFDQIFFTQVQFPAPVTPAEVERQMSRNVQNLQEKEYGTQEELPANMRNADYFIFGKMDTFSCYGFCPGKPFLYGGLQHLHLPKGVLHKQKGLSVLSYHLHI